MTRLRSEPCRSYTTPNRALRSQAEKLVTRATRLGDILVVQAIRAWIETDPSARSGWLGALKDRQIGRAGHQRG